MPSCSLTPTLSRREREEKGEDGLSGTDVFGLLRFDDRFRGNGNTLA